MTTKNQLNIGDMKYLSGSKASRVRVLQFPDDPDVLCKILTAPAGGKYEKYIGENVYINRRVLYPRGGR